MARIRTIKPEFFTHEKIVDLTPLARLLFISLWCEADREGRLNWRPKTIKIRYLPGDDCDVQGLAQQLVEQNLIQIYEVDGTEYCQVSGFSEHQVINNRERQSLIPAPSDASTTRKSGVPGEGRKERKERKEGTKPRVAKKIEVPEGINLEAWEKWEIYRRVDKKKKITQKAATEQFKLLSEYSAEQQLAIINESIKNDWQGLFKPKGGSSENTAGNGSSELDFDDTSWAEDHDQ